MCNVQLVLLHAAIGSSLSLSVSERRCRWIRDDLQTLAQLGSGSACDLTAIRNFGSSRQVGGGWRLQPLDMKADHANLSWYKSSVPWFLGTSCVARTLSKSRPAPSSSRITRKSKTTKSTRKAIACGESLTWCLLGMEIRVTLHLRVQGTRCICRVPMQDEFASRCVTCLMICGEDDRSSTWPRVEEAGSYRGSMSSLPTRREIT